ncbi:hypothetical protein OH77DRAFT_1419894 [Trametes cingulata]|nr:hypothetical protein OH77DRAFT_1419894 [Trametes cingulata]
MQAACMQSARSAYRTLFVSCPRSEETLSRELGRHIRDANGPGTGGMGLTRPEA